MERVVQLFYPKTTISKKKYGEITALVNECAQLGDNISQDILIKAGKFIGEQTAGVIKQVKIESLVVPVVIGGKVFSGKSPLLIDQFLTSLHRVCPRAYLVKPKYKPVVGGFLLALDELKISQSVKLEKVLDESGSLKCQRQ